MNEKRLRAAVFIIAAAIHILIIFFFVFDIKRFIQEESEDARVMKVTDLEELPPPPPEPEIPQVEAIAEVMIETDTPPIQEVVSHAVIPVAPQEEYLPMHLLSTPPRFNENEIRSALVYPRIAHQSGIEGNVILELFVDRTGTVQRVIILREDPPGRGFGEAAVRAFTGRRVTPATANGEAVSCRYRYPVSFRIR